jgi:hypothetical protein
VGRKEGRKEGRNLHYSPLQPIGHRDLKEFDKVHKGS